jgi:hypothetical protein
MFDDLALFYNPRRIHHSLNDHCPVSFERMYDDALFGCLGNPGYLRNPGHPSLTPILSFSNSFLHGSKPRAKTRKSSSLYSDV